MLAPPPLPRTIEASFRDLTAKKPQVRMSAIEDLARHATRDAVVRAKAVPLLARALSDEIAGVRGAAAVALADVRAKEALPALQVAMEDDDAYVRQMAISALGEIGDPRAAPRLVRALSDARPEVRYQAVIAYARVADDEGDALRAVESAMSDEDESVRYIALRLAEERVDAGRAAKAGEAGEAGKGEGMDAIKARALTLLDAPPTHVAVVAAILLAKLDGSPRGPARSMLLRVVDGTLPLPRGPAQEDEREVVELVGALGMKEAIPALERRAFGVRHFIADTCSYAATIALARLGHAGAREDLLARLRSRRRATREAAVVAVGRARMVEARPIVAALTGNDVDPELVVRALEDLGG